MWHCISKSFSLKIYIRVKHVIENFIFYIFYSIELWLPSTFYKLSYLLFQFICVLCTWLYQRGWAGCVLKLYFNTQFCLYAIKIFTNSNTHIFTFSHTHILTYSHLQIFSYSKIHIFINSPIFTYSHFTYHFIFSSFQSHIYIFTYAHIQ